MPERKSVFEVLDNVVTLKACPLFSTMKVHELRALSMISETMVFKVWEEIVTEGDVGDAMYIVKSGRVRVERKSENGEPITLEELGVGSYFGEMSVFDAELRSATVVATETSVVLRLKGDDLDFVITENPSISVEFLRTFSRKIRELNDRLGEKDRPPVVRPAVTQ